MLNIPQLKGGMCAKCKDRDEDCSHLPFYKMPVIKKEEDATNVKRSSSSRPEKPKN